jgi:hypothetical protein
MTGVDKLQEGQKVSVQVEGETGGRSSANGKNGGSGSNAGAKKGGGKKQ